jgi:hypothetical protein
MSLECKRTVAHLSGVVTVEEAESLLQWLQAHPKGRINLALCTHLHCANLMVLMALRPDIAAMPSDPDLASWLEHSLSTH